MFRASLDDFKRPWSERHLYERTSGAGYYRNAFDCEAARSLLLNPSDPEADGVVALCSIDPLTQIDHSAVKSAMPANGVLIVDGVFALRPEINSYRDLRIWLADFLGEEIRLRRFLGVFGLAHEARRHEEPGVTQQLGDEVGGKPVCVERQLVTVRVVQVHSRIAGLKRE